MKYSARNLALTKRHESQVPSVDSATVLVKLDRSLAFPVNVINDNAPDGKAYTPGLRHHTDTAAEVVEFETLTCAMLQRMK